MLVELTFEEAKKLQYGDILYHTSHTNADGSPQRWKVNGKVKSWTKDPKRIRVPIKHGLHSYGTITESDFNNDGVCSLLAIEVVS